MSKVRRIIDLANREEKNKIYNILTFPTHERYETQLCKTGHNFYSLNITNAKKWNDAQTPVPNNYYILPENELCDYINYDFILVQSKFWQYKLAKQVNQTLGLPIIILEHTIPTPQTIREDQLLFMKQMLGDLNVFISEYSRDAWDINDNTTIIHHGLDTETFKNTNTKKNKHVLTVANDFANRDYCLNYSGWQRITENLPVRLVGDSKGLSDPAKSVEDLVHEYNQCYVYLNTSTFSPIPMSLLEAMSCGCAVVSTATCMIPEIIQNGINGFISNDENEIRKYINNLLENEDLRNTIGKNARQTIVEKFSERDFIEKWNSVFDNIYEVSTL
jgi:glycosyltransferase involved in cell wall biosynthesis